MNETMTLEKVALFGSAALAEYMAIEFPEWLKKQAQQETDAVSQLSAQYIILMRWYLRMKEACKCGDGPTISK